MTASTRNNVNKEESASYSISVLLPELKANIKARNYKNNIP